MHFGESRLGLLIRFNPALPTLSVYIGDGGSFLRTHGVDLWSSCLVSRMLELAGEAILESDSVGFLRRGCVLQSKHLNHPTFSRVPLQSVDLAR